MQCISMTSKTGLIKWNKIPKLLYEELAQGCASQGTRFIQVILKPSQQGGKSRGNIYYG